MQTIKLCPIAVEMPSTAACAGVSRTAIIEAAMMGLEGSGSRACRAPANTSSACYSQEFVALFV